MILFTFLKGERRDLMHKICFYVLLLLMVTLHAESSLAKEAQKLFIEGQYKKALSTYDRVAQSETGVKRAKAHAMRAGIFEDYLGDIDSALAIYTKLLEGPLPIRLKKRWKRKEKELLFLVQQKEVYGRYRRCLVSRQSTEDKVEELVDIFETHPNFIKREELGRCLVSLYNEIGRYRKSYGILKSLKETGICFEPSMIEKSKRNAQRELIHNIAIGYFCLITFLAITLFLQTKKWNWLRKVTPFVAVWLLLTILFQVVYTIWFKDMDNNPFDWFAPLLLMSGFIPPFLWITLIHEKIEKGYSFLLIVILPAMCGIYLVLHTFLYVQKQSMDLMDTFTDRLQEGLGKEKTE